MLLSKVVRSEETQYRLDNCQIENSAEVQNVVPDPLSSFEGGLGLGSRLFKTYWLPHTGVGMANYFFQWLLSWLLHK